MENNKIDFCKNIEQHHIHLCTLSADEQKQMAASFTAPADYKCGHCGQKANLPKNCCDPVQLPELDQLGDGADNLYLEKSPR